MNTAKQGLTLFMRSKNMSDFDNFLEQAVKSILENKSIDLGDNPRLIRSGLKHHVQLLIYTRLDNIIKKLVPLANSGKSNNRRNDDGSAI